MREIVIKYTGILRWILIIGIMIILLGLSYFLGIFQIDSEYSQHGAPTNSFYGITYITLFTFGFYLVLLVLLLILPTLDRTSRKELKNYQQTIKLFGIFGSGLILYSLFINLNILPTLHPSHEWFDYFFIGMIISFSSYLAINFSLENFQEYSNYNGVWIFLLSIGIAFEILSLLTYWSLTWIIQLTPNTWGDLYFIGIIPLFAGGLPLLFSYKPSNQLVSTGLGLISLILIISGVVTYLVPTLALNSILFPLSVFKYNRYFDYLIFGSLLLIIGVSMTSIIEELYRYIQKLRKLWISLLFLGLLQYVISILMEITDTYFIDLGLEFLFLQSARGSLLFGMTWNVILFNSLITTLSVLIILSSLIFQETKLTNKEQKIE